MIKTNTLKGLIVEKGLTQADMAKIIGISANSFYSKMKNGVFKSNEVEIMIRTLNIKNPIEIFFADEIA